MEEERDVIYADLHIYMDLWHMSSTKFQIYDGISQGITGLDSQEVWYYHSVIIIMYCYSQCFDGIFWCLKPSASVTNMTWIWP